MTASAAETLTAALRLHRARLLAALVRALGDLERAEEALDEAVARALARWPTDGVPARPEGWLVTVGRRVGIDRFRRAAREAIAADEVTTEATDPLIDERLRLLFAVLHPALEARDQVALALRVFGSLEPPEIARALLVSEREVVERLRTARAGLRGQSYDLPAAGDLPTRLAGVLATIYLLYNEGYLSTRAETPVRGTLCAEAVRLGALLVELLPEEPEVVGLYALMTLHDARADARVSDGALVLLADQDRSRWDQSRIGQAVAALDQALARRRPGPYQIQAAIAALHATAPDAARTDWAQIAGLYGALLAYLPTPLVELNAAVALAMAAGPERGLRWLDDLARRGQLLDVHLFYAARGELLARAGRRAEAVEALRTALSLTTSPAERAALLKNLATLRASSPARRLRRPVRLIGAEREEVPALSEAQWARIADLFPRPSSGRGRPARHPRELINAALWVGATGAPWRDLPPRFGPWQTAFHHHRAWVRSGRWEEILERVAGGSRRGPAVTEEVSPSGQRP